MAQRARTAQVARTTSTLETRACLVIRLELDLQVVLHERLKIKLIMRPIVVTGWSALPETRKQRCRSVARHILNRQGQDVGHAGRWRRRMALEIRPFSSSTLGA